ncbi:MAG TPA: hypothetical protein VMG38_15340 [Trebonia sp.]|nr:hypothetical protein [Trebonia sp.]
MIVIVVGRDQHVDQAIFSELADEVVVYAPGGYLPSAIYERRPDVARLPFGDLAGDNQGAVP